MSNEKKNATTSETTVLKPNRPAKRVLVERKPKESSTFLSSSTDMILNDAKLIISCELARYRQKAMKGIALDLKEARVVSNYLSELTKLQKEEREDSKSIDLSGSDTLELMIELVKQDPKMLELLLSLQSKGELE